MTGLGEGYVWPKLDIWSDGVRTMLASRASVPEAKPFRYVGAHPVVVPSGVFEAALDRFMPQVIGRMRSEGVADSNLDRVWRDVLAERGDRDIARRRHLEALLGRDPDEIEDDTVERLIRDECRLGREAVDEVAAEHARAESGERAMLTADALERVARETGHSASVRDGVAFSALDHVSRAIETPAWKLGATAATALRTQERLGSAAIADARLADMAGGRSDLVTSSPSRGSHLSFALDDEQGLSTRVVVAARHKTGRRFSVARLLGDRLMHHPGALHPATHAYTYRQKAQRAFAAEFLCPFDAIEDMSHGDYSMDSQQDIADHFSVSPMLISASLKNNGRLERDSIDDDG